VKNMRTAEDLLPMAVTVAVSLATNMAYGFVAGIAASRLTRHILGKRQKAV
jgi:uncharacterized membrane protein